MHHVHAPLAPIRAYVKKGVLYDQKPEHADFTWLPCSVFAVSCYPGSVPTFKILLENGTVFSYIPPHALTKQPVGVRPWPTLKDVVYHDSPSEHFAVHTFDLLAVSPVRAYSRTLDEWFDAEYLFTIDWYTGNDLLHVLALKGSSWACLPQHKIKFGSDTPFERYAKMRSVWSVKE